LLFFVIVFERFSLTAAGLEGGESFVGSFEARPVGYRIDNDAGVAVFGPRYRHTRILLQCACFRLLKSPGWKKRMKEKDNRILE
jgi:hypothetical protein